MTEDLELEAWRADWQASTPPVPDVARWIAVQKRRFIAGNVLAGSIFAAGLSGAMAFLLGDASFEMKVLWGWILVLYVSGVAFTLWNQRGTWRASDQTTRGFLELSHRRALANIRALRAGTTMGLVGGLGTLGLGIWAAFRNGPAVLIGIVTGLAVSFVSVKIFFSGRRRRYKRDLEEAERLLAQLEV